MIASTGVRFSVSSLPTDVAARIRATLVDDFGNHLVVRPYDPAPCRHCLRITKAGEELIVFAYQPFTSGGPYAEVGPIFVHAQACEAYSARDKFPTDFSDRVLTMRGYNAEGTIETAALSEAGNPEATIERLLSNERVSFIHVRNPAWGCYDFRIDRVSLTDAHASV
jgi:Protein of unknown function (DUF1203)